MTTTSIARYKLDCLLQSVKNWKERSLKTNVKYRNECRKAKYHKEQSQKKSAKIEILEAKVKKLEDEAAISKSEDYHNKDKKISKNNLILILLRLAFICSVSFRSIPVVTREFFNELEIKNKIPHFTTIIFWCQKIGLYMLNKVGKVKYKYCLILDATITIGGEQVLLALRVKLDAIKKIGRALKPSDCQTVGIFPSSNMSGENICAYLIPLFKRIGYPAQILTDSGSNLKKAIKIAKINDKKCRKIITTFDISHKFANILKKIYINDSRFVSFCNHLEKASSLITQSQIAALKPPKIRTKGRFQSLSRVFNWALNARNYFCVNVREKDTKYQNVLKKSLSWLCDPTTSNFIDEISNSINALNDISKKIKTSGINSSIVNECLCYIEKTIIRTELKQKIKEVIKVYANNASRLSATINVSTDVIESIFGVYKNIIRRSPIKEIRKNSLLFPIITGNISHIIKLLAIRKIRKRDLDEWTSSNFKRSFLSKRRSITLHKKSNTMFC